MREGGGRGFAVVAVAIAATLGALAPGAPTRPTTGAPASYVIVPFQKVAGIGLGMTERQAKQGVGDHCPTLTARTRRNRALYDCYFTTAPLQDGTVELIYTSRTKQCGADATLKKGRILDVGSSCPGAISQGPGIGSRFKAMYAAFPGGSVRCVKGGQFQHECMARRKTPGGVFYTEFDDGKPIDQLPPLVLAEVLVGKCQSVYWSGQHNRGSINPCTNNFLVRRSFAGEFKP
jgi:hypothetical protein